MTFIIAEIGINHDGSNAKLCQLVRAAHNAGADAVKFQLFHPELIDRPEAVKAILRKVHLEGKYLSPAASFAKRLGMKAIVTPFGPHMLSLAESWRRFDGYKVSHAESHSDKWIDQCLRTNKPVFVSYCERSEKRADVTQMWCCPKYPTPLDEVNWELVEWFGGFSDHTGDMRAGSLAVIHGAKTIEAHITLNRHGDGPDHCCSLEPSDFQEYVRRIRIGEREAAPLQRDPRIDSHLELVNVQAKTFVRSHPGEDWRDYVASGYIGLDRAANNYNEDKGASFKTHATHKIRGAIWDQWKDEIGRTNKRRFERSFVSIETLKEAI